MSRRISRATPIALCWCRGLRQKNSQTNPITNEDPADRPPDPAHSRQRRSRREPAVHVLSRGKTLHTKIHKQTQFPKNRTGGGAPEIAAGCPSVPQFSTRSA